MMISGFFPDNFEFGFKELYNIKSDKNCHKHF